MALWLPRLPTDRLIRRAQSPSEAPLVVSHKANNALYVYALEARAQKLGLYKGQPLANARAMVQPLTIVTADEKADAALLEKIAANEKSTQLDVPRVPWQAVMSSH